MSSNMNNNIDYLNTLPYDIITEMVSHMDISTTESLVDQVEVKDPENERYQGVRDAAENRKSVAKYLSESFGDGVSLLEAMSRHYVYISGSRSLEFFSRGNVGPDSDWDFYVSRHSHHIYGIMATLEKLGVTWMTPEEELNLHVRDERRHMLIDLYKVMYLHDNKTGKWYENALSLGDVLRAEESADHFHVFMDNDMLMIEPERTNGGYASGEIATIIRGRLRNKKRTVPVQLIVEPRGDTEAYIPAPFTYHSSCVQSFIGPYTACHMYGRLVSENVSYGWRDNTAKDIQKELDVSAAFDRVDVEKVPGWLKYSQRGFEYRYPPEGALDFELRQPTDYHSTWLEYSDHTSAPRDVVYIYKQVAKSCVWFQVSRGTVPSRIKYDQLLGGGILDVGAWHDHPPTMNSEVSAYLWRYIPHMVFKTRGDRYTRVYGNLTE